MFCYIMEGMYKYVLDFCHFPKTVELQRSYDIFFVLICFGLTGKKQTT